MWRGGVSLGQGIPFHTVARRRRAGVEGTGPLRHWRTGGECVCVLGGGRHVPLAYFQFLETFGPAELSRFEQSPD